jgi:MYXO-CTERM domain-containing protein
VRWLVVLLLLAPGTAWGFCRKTTVDPDPGFVPTQANPCWTDGLPLFWRDIPVSYSVNQSASSQVSLPVTEDTMALAFEQWTSAMCSTPDGKTRLEVVFAGPTPSRLDATDKTNTVFFDDVSWPHQNPGTTIALTTVTFDTNTGRLLDADLELNTANFNLSTTDAVPAGGYDFRSIVTHESGHFLGLAHSIDPTATMFASYTPGTKGLRTLAQDDVDGICAIYPPSTGCSCTTTSSRQHGGIAGLLAIAAYALRRKRRLQPLSRAELEAMPTKQLLAQLQRLRVCEENIAASDFQKIDTDDTTEILFKDDPRWRTQVDEVKRILSTREHVPKAPERKAKRIARAAQTKSRSRPKRR